VLDGIELQSSNVMVAHSIVAADVSVPICDMNPTDQSITLHKGTTVPSSYNCTHACDSSHGTTRFCSHGPLVKVVVYDQEWF